MKGLTQYDEVKVSNSMPLFRLIIIQLNQTQIYNIKIYHAEIKFVAYRGDDKINNVVLGTFILTYKQA